MRLIYHNPETGIAAILTPAPRFMASLPHEWTEEKKLIHLADKDLPTGTKYEIVSNADLPNDRTFRGAWEYTAGENEKVSDDLSLKFKLKYNKILSAEETVIVEAEKSAIAASVAADAARLAEEEKVRPAKDMQNADSN